MQAHRGLRASSLRLIHQKRRCGLEERPQDLLHLVGKHRFVHRPIHQPNPPVARHLPNWERRVTHAQPRMASLFDVHRWSAESKNEEVPQSLFRAAQIVRRVDRSQDVVAGNLPVERRNQTLKSVMPDRRINLVLFHSVDRISRLASPSPDLPCREGDRRSLLKLNRALSRTIHRPDARRSDPARRRRNEDSGGR
jgi:hypothetical protein